MPNDEVTETTESSETELEVLDSDDKPEGESLEPLSEESIEEETDDSEDDAEESEEKDEGPGEDEEEEEEEVEVKSDPDSPKSVRFKDIKAKYPTLFKEFPELRANYFKSEQYGEIFPTVDDAKEASEKASYFDQLNLDVSSGDLSSALTAVHQNNPNAVGSIAERILPQLYQLNPQLYVKALNPELKRVLQTAWKEGTASKNDNLKNSAAHLAQWLGLDKQQNQAPSQTQDPEKEQLRNQLYQTYNRDISSYNESVYNDTGKELSSAIKAGINPKEFNSWQADKIVDDIINEINYTLSKDQRHMAEMNSLFQKAAKQGFSADSKASIVSAYLARAKMIIPAIRGRKITEASGKKVEVRKKTNVNGNSAPVRNTARVASKKEIREKRMSEIDFLNS